MTRGFLAALLILALGKPWCCCGLTVEAPAKPQPASSCCHHKPQQNSGDLPPAPEPASCQCKEVTALLPPSGASLQLPEPSVTPAIAWEDALAAIWAPPLSWAAATEHGPPRPVLVPLYLLHCSFRC